MPVRLALKVDADTDRGTRIGVANLAADCREVGAPACFLFSLGRDQTGRAISRVFRPGFFSKVSRTSVVEIYGVRTLLNGTLLPAPHIGRRNEGEMRAVRDGGLRGRHPLPEPLPLAGPPGRHGPGRREARVRGGPRGVLAHLRHRGATAGAPGWQSNERSRQVYDEAALLYSSDTRGSHPFFPSIGGKVFQTLEIPSTLPTLDELMGRPEFPDDRIAAHLLSLMGADKLNVFTLHAEIEGMGRRKIFRSSSPCAARTASSSSAWTTRRAASFPTAPRCRCASRSWPRSTGEAGSWRHRGRRRPGPHRSDGQVRGRLGAEACRQRRTFPPSPG
jgi:undecaprenyl phosphate-alpha-L-ara4FN deformylase